ncbi:hypothetical protein HHL16_18565 [Pseudoflavitalea sp. G-6-1-2]|uniref:PKD-like family lipoprotein n=1 Tax=Pseudoflavitalea sp. G-6-1-2 TaxID=2728841 RepID=UPI00146D3ECE|nr:PKD-like family lipoprotein [Pseudoflavitalea sp. G-6-1-2]NML22889.1 hypothetical protein [Pseudoflavitalea sp. G-6-1-2]
MKKIFYIVLSLVLSTAMIACYKDKGNYNYDANELITIKGLEKGYSKLSMIERLQIDPEVSSSMPGAQLEYLWRMYEYPIEGVRPKMVTIGTEKKLDYLVENDAREWVLLLTVTNKKTGFAQTFETRLNVATNYTQGWYVLKSDNNQSDIDLFKTPENIFPGIQIENVFSKVNNRKLAGNATLLQYYNNYKNRTSDGKSENVNTLFALTDKDGSAVRLNTMTELRSFGKFFWDYPAVMAPGFLFEGGYGKYVVNDGSLYGIFSFNINYGTFGARILADNKNRPYSLNQFYLTNFVSLPVMFDDVSSSFMTADLNSPYMYEYGDADGTSMPAAKNNQRLLFMGQASTFPFKGYAVMQDKTDPNIKVVASIEPTSSKLKITTSPILPGQKLFNARLHTLINNSENLLYFVTGNELYSRGLSSGVEELQFKAPEGETITFIRHRWYTASLDPAYKFDYVMVGTTSGGKYKVRMFKKQAGSLVTTPDFILEGNGEPRDVIYISPRMRPSQEIINSY